MSGGIESPTKVGPSSGGDVGVTISAKAIHRSVLVLLLALVAGCGRNNGPSVRTEVPPDELEANSPLQIDIPENASDVAKRYLEVFASDRPPVMNEMLQLSAPDSPAHLYARFQVAATQATADQGIPPAPSNIQYDGDIVRLCTSAEVELPPGGKRCSSYSDFAASSDTRLLRSFSVDGKPIQDRLVRGGSTAMAGRAKFSLVVGYQAASSESLLLVVEIVNGPNKISVYGNSATYIGTNGRQLQASMAVGPFDVQPSATASVVIGFTDATPGGRLILQGFDGSTELEASLAVAP